MRRTIPGVTVKDHEYSAVIHTNITTQLLPSVDQEVVEIDSVVQLTYIPEELIV